MRYFIRQGDAEHQLVVSGDAAGSMLVDGEPREVTIHGAAGSYRVVIDGRVVDLSLREIKKTAFGPTELEVQGLGHRGVFEISSDRERPLAARNREGRAARHSVLAQMPGRVLQVRVRAGDPVAEGQALLVIEAMKMENELYADAALTVVEVLVKAGDAVETGTPLLLVER